MNKNSLSCTFIQKIQNSVDKRKVYKVLTLSYFILNKIPTPTLWDKNILLARGGGEPNGLVLEWKLKNPKLKKPPVLL